jgi:L-lactate dehydrogenase (cytochrome)
MEPANELQISSAELEKHSTRHDCWVAVHSKVWDLTDFIDEHPGGAKSKSNISSGYHLFTNPNWD